MISWRVSGIYKNGCDEEWIGIVNWMLHFCNTVIIMNIEIEGGAYGERWQTETGHSKTRFYKHSVATGTERRNRSICERTESHPDTGSSEWLSVVERTEEKVIHSSQEIVR